MVKSCQNHDFDSHSVLSSSLEENDLPSLSVWGTSKSVQRCADKRIADIETNAVSEGNNS